MGREEEESRAGEETADRKRIRRDVQAEQEKKLQNIAEKKQKVELQRLNLNSIIKYEWLKEMIRGDKRKRTRCGGKQSRIVKMGKRK